jgi:hypothetical protein
LYQQAAGVKKSHYKEDLMMQNKDMMMTDTPPLEGRSGLRDDEDEEEDDDEDEDEGGVGEDDEEEDYDD